MTLIALYYSCLLFYNWACSPSFRPVYHIILSILLRLLQFKRMYLPYYNVVDTPFYIHWDDLL